ncbi:MAG TPA: extracellular solute-binding protein [Herbaspirillum sp.]|jgi:iron(III) transport system substrate-binding protein
MTQAANKQGNTRGAQYLKVVCGIATAVAMSLSASAYGAPAVNAPGPNDAIYMYKGADRDQKLVEAAKKEGSVTVYSSLSSGESTPLIAAFEKKYGIKVNFWRANSDQVAQRMMTEGQARRYVVDVLETNGSEVEMAARERLLSEFYSPYLADLPPDAIAPNRLWVSDRSNFIVVAYNTNKVKRADLPTTYEGFLDPKWKGQVSIEASDIEWLATIVKKMGNDKGMKFFQALSATNPQMRAGHILLAQMVGAGEVPVALTVYNGEVESLKRKGTPIDWAPVQPVVGRPQGMGVAKNAPHPHAALLFADYVLSPENQMMYAKLGRVPTSTKAKTKLNDFPHVMIDTGAYLDESEKWTKLWNELLMKK